MIPPPDPILPPWAQTVGFICLLIWLIFLMRVVVNTICPKKGHKK